MFSISALRSTRGGLAVLVGALLTSGAAAGSRVGTPLPSAAPADSTDRLIVKLRDPLERDAAQRVTELGGQIGERLLHRRAMSGNAHVVQLARRMSRSEAAAVAQRLARDRAVAYAEPDTWMVAQRVPNDSYWPLQWNLFEAAGGIDLPSAWDRTVGSAQITVAVVDTGIVAHADLASRLVAGYDFIGDVSVANDGNGRDADASDPGDFGCNGSSSSWHGTHVAGIIGAVSDNGSGVAGINWASRMQSARVLGRCGGYTSDIADAIRWSSGIAVVGVPANATPARVVNLSLGGSGACGTTLQNAVNDVTARGTIVVAAAGNSAADAGAFSPANCAGVIAVAATVRNGGKAGYSNFGSTIAISAPGGDGGNGILSTLNAGTTVPAADNYAYYAGTSMAAPHVTGVVSLMLSANPALTPAQVLAILRATARPFPVGTGADCTAALCGAGIVDAAAAVAAAVPVSPPPPSGARVNLALASNGAVATASSTASAAYPPSAVNDGDRRGAPWGAGGGWADGTPGAWGDWVQVDLGTVRTVAEIDVFSIQDAYTAPQDPTETLGFSLYGLVDFDVQVWDGAAWSTVPGGSVTGNNKVWRKFAFAPITTRYLRVLVSNALNVYSRIAEIEAYEVADAPPASALRNVALQANGGVASASSTASSSYPPSAVNNGDRRGTGWGAGGGWADGSPGAWPDWVQVDFNGTKTISEIDVFLIQDNYAAPQDPTQTLVFSRYGLTDFDVQYWSGSAWLTVPGGNVSGNDKVWRQFVFAPVVTTSVRVTVRGASDLYSRIAEIEVYGTP